MAKKVVFIGIFLLILVRFVVNYEIIEKELSGELHLMRSLLGGALARIFTKEAVYTDVNGLT